MRTISVVTIVWNDAAGFVATARSVVAQTGLAFEWIVVDGASTDGTSRYVSHFRSAIARCVCEPDDGIYDAMNKGVRLARGDWIMFLNADDVFARPDTLATYAAALKEDDDIVYADAQRREDGQVHPYRAQDDYELGMTQDHQTTCIRRSLYEQMPFDTTLRSAGDLDFFSRARVAGCRFRKIGDVVTVVKPFGEGMSSDYLDRQFERVTVLKRHFDSPTLRKRLAEELAAYQPQDAAEHEKLHRVQEMLA